MPGRIPAAWLALALLCACSPKAPKAREGLLDLGGRSLADGPVALDGEWEFFPGQLLAPQDFSASSVPAGYLALPGDWSGFRTAGRPIPGHGFGTLRLKVRLAAGVQEAGFRVDGVSAAYALWVDGQRVGGSGTLGRTAEEEVPRVTAEALRVPSALPPAFDVVLQVSNHTYRAGGLLAPMRLGAAATMADELGWRWSVALFFVGGLLVMGVYHLLFYWFRRSNLAMLHLGLYCLLWTGYYLLSDSSGFVARSFLPGMSQSLMDRISMGAFFLSVPTGYAFFRALYPEEFSRRVHHLSLGFAAAFCALAVTLPLPWFHTALPGYYAVAMALIVHSLHRLARAQRQGREGALSVLAGFGVLGAVGINDMLHDLGVIHTALLLPVGMFAFVLLQAVGLSSRVASAFGAVERLSGELLERNRAMQEEMQARARLEREIVRVTEEERRNISHALHDGLCQQLTAARLQCSVMQRRLGEAPPAGLDLHPLSGLLDASVAEAYSLARGLWPVEHEGERTESALRDLVRRFGEAHGVAVEFVHDADDVASDRMVQLYRIAQEAMGNAVKHGHARHVRVALIGTPELITLTVSNDGLLRSEAAPSKGGLGLRIMNYRARMLGGELVLEDVPGGGTRVTCTIPRFGPDPTSPSQPPHAARPA